MPSRQNLIEYISENETAFSEQELRSYPFETLVLMKVRIEVEKEEEQNEFRMIELNLSK
jgi:hypothetical protein